MGTNINMDGIQNLEFRRKFESECGDEEGFTAPVLSNNAEYRSEMVSNVIKSDAGYRVESSQKPKLRNRFKKLIKSNAAVVRNESKKGDVLSFPSDVDSDSESPKVGLLWDSAEMECSDAESVDDELMDPLHHNTVFTEEEVVLSIRNKLLRLQNLYIKEYRRIIMNMKEKQKDYATLMKKEKESYGPLLKPANLTPKELLKYNKLKALSQYQKVGTGPETLLFKKMIEKRKAATSCIHSRSRIFNKCVYSEGGMRCPLKVIPGSKYCLKHILKDPSQVLFQSCGTQKGDSLCEEPVPVTFENNKCPLHATISGCS